MAGLSCHVPQNEDLRIFGMYFSMHPLCMFFGVHLSPSGYRYISGSHNACCGANMFLITPKILQQKNLDYLKVSLSC